MENGSIAVEDDEDMSSLASDIDERNENSQRVKKEGEKRLDRGVRSSIISKTSVGREPRTSSVTNFNRNQFHSNVSISRNVTPGMLTKVDSNSQQSSLVLRQQETAEF